MHHRWFLTLCALLLLCIAGSAHGAVSDPPPTMGEVGRRRPDGAVQSDPSTPPDLMKDFEVLRQQLEQNPRDVGVLNSMGIIYARAGRLPDAMVLWQRGLAIDPKYVHLYNNLGSALKTQKRYDEALRVFAAGLRVEPSYWLYHNLGLLYKETGRRNEAITSFQAALRTNPRFEPAARKLAELGVQVPPTTAWAHVPGIPQLPLPGEFKPPVMDGNLGLDDSVALGRRDAPVPPDRLPPPAGAPERTAVVRRPSPPARIEPAEPYTIDTCAAAISRLSGGGGAKLVALTFDDGPHAAYTRQLLDYFRAQGVKATFFVLGSRAEAYPDLITRMSEEGHEIANHTWSHKSLVNQGSGAGLGELRRTSDMIAMLTGSSPRLVRPPYGHTNARVRGMIQGQGWREVMWDADSRDWAGGSSDRMLARVVRSFSPECIVLFHDIHPGALRVLPVLVPALKKCGYRFVTVSQLLGSPNHAG
ncbi:MAG TPA: polysaccharide deacetylase family protein [Candidatus Ozemobacteraceae bacterium]|nr:polysaccharide deacetylase family protein [Candidatus Ozemobacteraceae bacterium]